MVEVTVDATRAQADVTSLLVQGSLLISAWNRAIIIYETHETMSDTVVLHLPQLAGSSRAECYREI